MGILCQIEFENEKQESICPIKAVTCYLQYTRIVGWTLLLYSRSILRVEFDLQCVSYRKYVPTASTAAVAAPMAPETWEAPLDPADPDAEALASAEAEDSVALDDSVAESSEPTAVEPAELVASVESVVPLDVMFMLLSMPDAAVEAAVVVSAAAEEAVEVAADVVAAAEAAVEAPAEV
ncbi:hypothetical protein JG687_00014785 [Phytophthora cactorum]|uniref:Uncharacterized protein n=1 Tax=Phytophthora cactorum TaxID=29920 RepID=A0A8T1TVK9_9STRA|nr:hypothetical protein GQ600_20644 [Phytophthora cactorum]KAG6949558.1 hypothetical protein JG687_00014785 [Phytophthora cactorum]